MTTMTFAPAAGAFANDPFYALGTTDAHNEYADGDSIHTLKQRATQLLDAEYPTTSQVQPAELYRLGYANAVVALMNRHIATVDTQSEKAHKRWAQKNGRRHTPASR